MFQIIDEKRRNDDVCNLPYGIVEKVPNPMNILAEVRFQSSCKATLLKSRFDMSVHCKFAKYFQSTLS